MSVTVMVTLQRGPEESATSFPIEVRRLDSVEEYQQCEKLQAGVWGPDDVVRVPALVMVAAQVNGFADITLDSSAGLLSAWDQKLTTGISRLNGVNNDAEILNITRNHNLAVNAVASMSILQQQEASVVELLQRLAGLV